MRRYLLLYNAAMIDRANVGQAIEEVGKYGVILAEIPFKSDTHNVLCYMIDLDKCELGKCCEASLKP